MSWDWLNSSLKVGCYHWGDFKIFVSSYLEHEENISIQTSYICQMGASFWWKNIIDGSSWAGFEVRTCSLPHKYVIASDWYATNEFLCSNCTGNELMCFRVVFMFCVFLWTFMHFLFILFMPMRVHLLSHAYQLEIAFRTLASASSFWMHLEPKGPCFLTKDMNHIRYCSQALFKFAKLALLWKFLATWIERAPVQFESSKWKTWKHFGK